MSKKNAAPASVVSLAKEYPTVFELANAACKGDAKFLKRVVEAFADACGMPAKYFKAQRDRKQLVSIRLVVPSRCGLTLVTRDAPSDWCADYGVDDDGDLGTCKGATGTEKLLVDGGANYRLQMSKAMRKSVVEAKKVIELHGLLLGNV